MLVNLYNNIFYKDIITQKTGLIAQNNAENLCRAVIAGVVSITACCNNVALWAAAMIGVFACVIFQ